MDDAVRALVERLERRIAELEAENQRLRERIEELERAAARQAAPFRRPEKKKVPEADKKRPGRPVGHAGACRAVPEQVDAEVEVPLPQCPQCQGPVREVHRLEQYIEEIPPIRPQVTKVVTYCGSCQRCGEVRSLHPLQTSTAQGAAKVQLGPRALAWAASLNKAYGLTARKTCAVLEGLLGLKLTAGGLTQAVARLANKVSNGYDALLAELRQEAAVFADETSWWVGGPGWWLWTFTTPQTTVYRVDESRGSQVVEHVLGSDFQGMLVSDCLASYDPAPFRKHKCIAHHLRAIVQARASPEEPESAYCREWRLLFTTVCVLAKARPHLSAEAYAQQCAAIAAWRDRLLAEPGTMPADAKVHRRLAKQREHLLGCLEEPAAEATNNRAERALRPAVIARKVSCGNKTPAGKRTWEILTSLAVTCRQRAESFIDYLTARLPLASRAAAG
jgi:transposase